MLTASKLNDISHDLILTSGHVQTILETVVEAAFAGRKWISFAYNISHDKATEIVTELKKRGFDALFEEKQDHRVIKVAW